MQMNSIGMNILSAFSNLIIICHSAFSNLIISNKTTIIIIFVTHPSSNPEEKKNRKYLRSCLLRSRKAPETEHKHQVHGSIDINISLYSPKFGSPAKKIHPTQIFWIVVAPMSDVRCQISRMESISQGSKYGKAGLAI